MKHLATTAFAALVAAAAASAQDTEIVRVVVTSSAGRSVYLDHGSAHGLAPGLTVELFAPGAAGLRAVVRTVSTSSARAELPPGVPAPPAGTRGEVAVPRAGERVGERAGERAQDPSRDPAARAVPEHPPWTLQDFPRGTDAPLLAPAFGGGPASRPARWHGRVFAQSLWDGDRERDGVYQLWRAGTRTSVDNAFGDGGRVQLEGEIARREIDFAGDPYRADDRVRIDRLSYAHGDDAHAAWRWELGRFTSVHAPELGLVDGVEALRRLGSGLGIGAGFGALPLPYPARSNGEDIGVHAFVDYRPLDDARLVATAGFQKTWHEGDADRDLLFGRADWMPADAARVSVALQIDFHGSDDALEPDAVELSELWANGSLDLGAGAGVGVSVSHFSWPELLRRELAAAPADLVRDGRIDRASAHAWCELADGLRATVRGDLWQDQDDDGAGGEIAFDWRRIGGSALDASLAWYRAAGAFLRGPGVRAGLGLSLERARWSLFYDELAWDTRGLGAGGESFRHRRAGVTFDWYGSGAWALSLDGDHEFGDGEDAYHLGVFAEYRF